MSICREIHEKLNNLPRFDYPFYPEFIPSNGIYIIFERNEFAHGVDKVVHIGTHNSQNGLVDRLCEIFENENKNRSILRKYIGGCILNKLDDSYVNIWRKNTTRTKVKKNLKELINVEYERKIEEQVTKYIIENLSFVVIEEDDKNKRTFIKNELISEISRCEECNQSTNWLGNYAVNHKVKNSGLWNDNGLYKERTTNYIIEKLSI